ncbi:MAG: hypothetical protein ABSH09_12335 [Bryobacteraceae bacterium]
MALLETILLAALACAAFTQTNQHELTPAQVGEIVNRLHAAVKDYVFPDIAAKLQEEIEQHRTHYRTITGLAALTGRLTEDMRGVGHDRHLRVTFNEQLAVQNKLTPEEKRHAHAFDLSSGLGIRSARWLSGNIGYIDLRIFLQTRTPAPPLRR